MSEVPPPLNSGAPNGPGMRQPFNRWFRYPAGFARDLAGPLLSPVRGRSSAKVLDPFAGVATLAPWLSLNGHEFLGLEAHPLVAEIGHLKAGAWPSPDRLDAAGREVLENAPPSPDLDAEHEVVQRCFDPEVLGDLVGLRSSVDAYDKPVAAWLGLALTATLRDVSSSHVGWPYQRPGRASQARCHDARARFSQRVGWMAADIRSAQEERETRTLGRVAQGDARQASAFCSLLSAGGKADLCITSPPYLNNYDYADATRLELFFLGRADSWASMCRYARDGMVVASTQQTRRERAELARQHLAETSIGGDVKDLVDRIDKASSDRKRPKEYDRLVLEYFSDMKHTLKNVRDHLVDGGPLLMAVADSALYGVHVHTPRLLERLAVDVGFRAKSITMHRSRGHRWKGNPQRESSELGEYLLHLVASKDEGSLGQQTGEGPESPGAS